jgi:hypothetical protein
MFNLLPKHQIFENQIFFRLEQQLGMFKDEQNKAFQKIFSRFTFERWFSILYRNICSLIQDFNIFGVSIKAVPLSTGNLFDNAEFLKMLDNCCHRCCP